MEQVDTTRQKLTAQLAQNRAQADAVARQIDLLTAQEAQARAALAAQQAALQLATINLGYTRIVSPTDGVIGVRQVFPGQYLAPGAQVTTLAALPHVWVIANYKETQLTHVAVGQPASITVDTFPGTYDCAAMSWRSPRPPALSSPFCRPTMPPEILPRSCNASP